MKLGSFDKLCFWIKVINVSFLSKFVSVSNIFIFKKLFKTFNADFYDICLLLHKSVFHIFIYLLGLKSILQTVFENF